MNNVIMTIRVLLTCVLFAATSCTMAASFECKNRRQTNVEHMICADEVLSQMDSLLAKSFKTLSGLSSPDQKLEVVEEQKDWLRVRDKDCIDRYRCADSYYSRLAALRRLSAPLQLAQTLPSYRTTNDLIWDPNFIYFLNNYFGSAKYVDEAGRSYPLLTVVTEALGGPPEPLLKESGVYIAMACAAHACNLKGMVVYDSARQKAVFAIATVMYSEPAAPIRATIYYKDPAFERAVEERMRALFSQYAGATEFASVRLD